MRNSRSFEQEIGSLYKNFEALKEEVKRLGFDNTLILVRAAQKEFEEDVFKMISTK